MHNKVVAVGLLSSVVLMLGTAIFIPENYPDGDVITGLFILILVGFAIAASVLLLLNKN